MADLTITAANVKPVDGSTSLVLVNVGEALTPGQMCFRHATSGTWFALDCDDSDDVDNISAKPGSLGVLVFGGAVLGDLAWVCTGGPLKIGATVTPGVGYYASDTAGGICPGSDLASGDVPIYLGTAIDTDELHLAPANHKSAL